MSFLSRQHSHIDSEFFNARQSSLIVKLASILTFSLLTFSLTLTPQVASADLFGVWVKPKIDFVGGTGDVFEEFGGLAYGGEVGIEVLGLSLWADAESAGGQQFWASGNMGIDFSFGDDIELTLGVYGGVVYFQFPADENKSSGLDQSQQDTLNSIPNIDPAEIESAFNQIQAQEESIANSAFGVNGRVRGSLEYHFIPALSLGIQVSVAYHVILSGDQASSEVKSKAVDKVAKDEGLPEEAKKKLKEVFGAEEVELSDLKGTNYSFGLFLNVSF
jgi:hypothetical protein